MSECTYCAYYGESVEWSPGHAGTHPIIVPESQPDKPV